MEYVILHKINIVSWCAWNDRLPTLTNLDAKGVDLNSIRCQRFDEDPESCDHVFCHCLVAQKIWSGVAKWWNLDVSKFTNLSIKLLISIIDHISIPEKLQRVFDAVVQV